jgi:cobalt-zinc-cadmium resistance protein CzcA
MAKCRLCDLLNRRGEIGPMPFSISAGVGFIALSSVSVLADMVMVSTILSSWTPAWPSATRPLQAAKRRLWSVLMTVLVTGLGFSQRHSQPE